jgi:hypothetical protein
MVSFKIDETEYKVPDFISIGDYVKLFKVKDLFVDEYFAAKMVSLVSGCPVEDLLQSDYEQVTYLASYIMTLIPTDNPKFVDRFELDGVQYGFFPNWRDLTYGEFVDMDTISTKKQEEVYDLIHILCAIMYRPITTERSEHDFDIEKYDVKKMTQRAELFKKKLDVKYILGAMFFFINYERKFSAYTQISLIPKLSIQMRLKLLWKMRKILWKMSFNKSSVGSLSQTEFLEMILQSTSKSIKRQ